MKHPIRQVLPAFVVLCLVSGTPLAQQYAEESRTVPEFSAVEVGGKAVVYMHEGTEEEVRIRASGIPISDIRTEVVDSELKVYTVGRHSGEDIQVHVTFDNLTQIFAKDSAEVHFDGEFYTESLIVRTEDVSEITGVNVSANTVDVSINGAGNANLEIDADLLRIAMRDSGDLTVSGVAQRKEIESISSNGTFYDQSLEIIE